jgi:peptidoglycan DL-endopeptidase CwlO
MAHRSRVRGRRAPSGGFVLSAVLAGLALAGHAGHGAAAGGGQAAGRAAAAIGYARAQLGRPYVWGGTGPGGFDCSGLVMRAWAAAGITLPRTSQQQWAAGPRVSVPAAGDLVFFAGGDGTVAAPGHVGLVVDPARHLMIEAYAPGYPVRYARYGTSLAAPGDTSPVGFTDPAGAA